MQFEAQESSPPQPLPFQLQSLRLSARRVQPLAQDDGLFHVQLMQAPQVLAEDALAVEGLEPEG